MPRDPLDALVRVRQIALDEARRALAVCLAAEDAAETARVRSEAAITQERDAAERLDAGDAAVEAFAAWLPIARERLRQTIAAYERSLAETARARAVATLAQSAHEAAEDALARKREAERVTRQGQEQLALEEAARRPRKQ